MKQQSQGSSRNTSWSRVVGVLLAMLVLAMGSVAVASEPPVDTSPDTVIAQGQPADAPAPSDTATSSDSSESNVDRES